MHACLRASARLLYSFNANTNAGAVYVLANFCCRIVITVGDLMNKEHEICVPDSTTFYEFGRRYADLVGYSKCKLYYKYDGMTINFDSRLKLKEVCKLCQRVRSQQLTNVSARYHGRICG